MHKSLCDEWRYKTWFCIANTLFFFFPCFLKSGCDLFSLGNRILKQQGRVEQLVPSILGHSKNDTVSGRSDQLQLCFARTHYLLHGL